MTSGGLLPDSLADPPPWTLEKLTAKAPRQNVTRASQNGYRPFAQDVGERGAHWLGKALQQVAGGASRNDTGHWLACQLRDARLSELDAEPWMKDYAAQVPPRDHPYTEEEALATLHSAFGSPPREPAHNTALLATTSADPLEEPTSSSSNHSSVSASEQRSFPLYGADGQNHAEQDAAADAGDDEVSSLTARGKDGSFPLLSLADLAKVGTFRPEVLLPGKIMRRSLNLTYGDGDTGKSYFAQDACFGLAASGIPVWYVAAEGFDGIYLRILAWLGAHPGQSLAALRVVPVPVQIFRGPDARILAAQARDAKEPQRPALVVLDTLHRCTVGARENDNSDMVCVANTHALWRSEFGGTSWVVHHEGKSAGAGMRGASCLYDDADSVQYIFRGGDISVIECEKQKDGIPRFTPEVFTLVPHSLNEQGYPGLSAKVLEPLSGDHIIEARRLWRADQQRRQPGAKNAVGGDDGAALSGTLKTAMEVFDTLYKQYPDGVFKSTWKQACEAAGIKAGSTHWVITELERRGKVMTPNTTGRYLPAT